MDVMAAAETRMAEDEFVETQPTIQGEEESRGGEAENKFQKALASWRSIDLSSLIPKLDATASEVVGYQREALVERKELAQKTKEFRKLDDAGKLVEYKSLLKAYQTFIDLITTHGKTSSSAFLQLYSSLSEAPDPFPLLEASVESLVVAEDTLPKLMTENADLQHRVKRLTDQLEDTERRLEKEITSRREIEDGSSARIQEVEETWAKVLEEKQSNWDAKEKTLEEKVENQDRLLKEIKASYEVSQRLSREGDAGSDTVHDKATAAEFEIMSLDLEKTSARLAEIEARNEQLRLKLAQAVSQVHAGHSTHTLEDDPAYARLQTENSSLLRKLEATRFERDGQIREWENKCRQLERYRSQLSADNQDLRAKVERWADYDELRRELAVLRSIEVSTGDEDAADPVAVQMNGSAHPEKKESLEQLLLQRNKKLSNELTTLRVSHQDLTQQLESLRADLSMAKAELEKSQNLSSVLENDLLKVQEEVANAVPSSGMSVAGTYTTRNFQPSRRGRTSPTSSIISGYDMQPRGMSATLESLRSAEPVGGGSGILPMIQAQRDRFKQKNLQLEEELSKAYATVASLRQEVASLQKDNLSLYEKSRYVSAYNRGPNTTTSSSAYSQGPSHTSIQISPDSSGPSDRYRSQYESNISPFAAFRGRESARVYKKMSLPERAIFFVTRMVLATRTSRNLFAGYCLALHVLIFLMLYSMGTADVEKHATHLGDVAAAAVGGAALNPVEAEGSKWHQEGFG